MSNRSWFYAANGQQQGPFPEAQLRDLITRGTVRGDTLLGVPVEELRQAYEVRSN